MTRLASVEATAIITAIITAILCDNHARERSFGAHSPLAFERRIAVKTGKSGGFRDAWTVGFDRRYTVAVWTGNFDGHPMRDTLAIRSATPLWASIMRARWGRTTRWTHLLSASGFSAVRFVPRPGCYQPWQPPRGKMNFFSPAPNRATRRPSC